MIAVVDYGAGNTGSVLKAARYLGYAAERIERAESLPGAEKIILPGQGHFGSMMRALNERGMAQALRSAIGDGKPFLGICLGLQMLYEGSEEAPDAAGLGLLAGRVQRFEGVFKVPHVGWNQLKTLRPARLLQGIAPGSFVYYCHSYYGPVTPESTATTEYGQQFSAVMEMGSVCGVQFHPEKSGAAGLKVLKNFLSSC
ncbi:MAG: imidazole glycerol phosphate synthase subunit HisH [Candidatus Acidiferrales bacterium]